LVDLSHTSKQQVKSTALCAMAVEAMSPHHVSSPSGGHSEVQKTTIVGRE